MHNIDIRKYKLELREQCKKRRREMPAEEKLAKDLAIAEKVTKLYQYRSAKLIMIYVSTAIEVDTYNIIKRAWQDGKKVAVPRCIPYTRQKEYHYITSFDDLSPGTFSVLEPDESLPIVTDFSESLMLVPAFIFSANGYRLGYGKGYYDRYMSRYDGSAVGICYVEDFKLKMFHGRYDRPVETVVTNEWIRNTSKNRKTAKLRS